MSRRYQLLLYGLVGAIITLATVMLAAPEADAHGSMSSPASRTYACYLEGAESPDSAACKAAVALGGTQPLYDWNEVNIANAAGRHKELIPDGRLCSAGRDKYGAFDVARADWPATRLPSGGQFEFRYKATAPHRGGFDLYLTRNGYDPRRPLRWADLDLFYTVADLPLRDGALVMSAPLPGGRTGRHLLYSVWQRTDSPEAFYSCADVVFGNDVIPGLPPPVSPDPPPVSPDPVQSTSAPAPSPSVPAPTDGHSHHVDDADPPGLQPTAPDESNNPSVPAPIGAPPSEAEAWEPHHVYLVGDRVSFGGRTYWCVQGHTSLPTWQPDVVLALWLVVGEPGSDGDMSWQPYVAFPVGANVVHNGRQYRCVQAHTSQPGWEPDRAPALWLPQS
jgi:chitin-binding protein